MVSEVVGAICSILVIWVLTGILVYIAVLRVKTPPEEFDADVMLGTAGAGVFFNIL